VPARPLTPEDFEHEAGGAFRRVFASSDPTDAPFTAAMTERTLVWHWLDLPRLQALTATARSMGDVGCYAHATERDPERHHRFRQTEEGKSVPDTSPLEWYVSFDDLAALEELVLPLRSEEHVLLSPAGRWGTISSQHGQTLLAGEAPFVTVALQNWPGGPEAARAEMISWLEDLRDEGGSRYAPGSDPLSWGWLDSLLAHVYGQSEAEQLLRETRILR
jgi:hypothetical protein